MWLIHRLIEASVRNRWFVIVGVLVFAVLGVRSFMTATFDAFPDLTNVQVQVLTSSAGMSSEEIEKLVTAPIERAMGGLPGMANLRSKSRAGISAVTVVFEDGTDLWRARQLVKERLDLARDDIPEAAGIPEIAPPSTGLGEVYQFTVRAEGMPTHELYRVFQRQIAPRLRSVPGVVEVNAWGGGAPQLELHLDPFALAAHGVSLLDLRAQLEGGFGVSSGGALIDGAEQILTRGRANPTRPEQLEDMTIQTNAGAAVRLGSLGTAREGGALTVGMGSADGRGEAMFVMVQLLAGADALSTVRAIREKTEEVKQSLPAGIEMEMIYDREKLVGSSLATVAKSLTEGGLLVILVLFLLLGDFRAGLLTASIIPLSMLGAFMGLNALGYSGNLMSLGAIDFGLIVDGTIVVTESIVALTAARSGAFGEAVADRAKRVAKPVVFAVGILILVYTPILLMWGVEGKLFRPMALTVLLALTTALILTFTYVPAMASWLLKPRGDHRSWLEQRLQRLYRPVLRWFMGRPGLAAAVSAILIALSVLLGGSLGVEFTPRLEEGDIVVQTARLPSLSPEQALRESTRVETILGQFPEVIRVASRTGAPAVATDPMGLEEADILVQLKPKTEWTTASTLNGLMAAMAERLEAEAPGAAFAYTQPIEMRFNELLQGVTSDVGVKIYGDDMDVLLDLAADVAARLARVPGAADVTPPVQEGAPLYDVAIDEERRAFFGMPREAVLATVQTLQRGLPVGKAIRGEYRDDIVLKLDYDLPLDDLPLVLPNGRAVPLGDIADVGYAESPNVIQREGGSRRVAVLANVRGRDLAGFVQAAQAAVADLEIPPGYWIAWSGKYEQLRQAATRMAIIIPGVLFLIMGVLYTAFQNWRASFLIFLNIPVAASGGFMLLWLRDLPISLSAAVGFIALFGIAVMNGIVMISRVLELNRDTPAAQAASESALERFRPVVMTAAVAGIGFLPMALARGVGAEVQRPLATVVIGGLITCTLLTLLVLPSLYARIFAKPRKGGEA